jgi:hypothetical protein
MTYLHTGYEPNGDLPCQLAQAMLRAVQRNYGRLIAEARKEWERRFADSDPSDACVTVRVSGSNSREFSRLFPLESFRQLEPFVIN